MSTRSEIQIVGKSFEEDFEKGINTNILKLYHHHDSYPEGVGKFLMEEVYPLLQKSNDETPESIANFLIKHPDDTEFELTAGYHVDIEYSYVIYIPQKKIKCFAGYYNYEWGSDKKPEFIVRKDIDLSRFLPVKASETYA